MKTKKQNNNKNSLYFWLGEEAEELEEVTEEEFKQRQKGWDGERP